MLSSPSRFAPVTYGRTHSVVGAGPFTLITTRHAPGLTLPSHAHERAFLTYVISGSVSERVGRRSIHCAPRSLMLRPAGAVHSNRYGDVGAHCLLIEIGRAGLADGASPPVRDVAYFGGGTLPALAARAYAESTRTDAAAATIIEGLVLEIIGMATRDASRAASRAAAPGWLRQVRERLDDEAAATPALSELAREAGVSRGHLARHFRRHFGSSVGDYLRARRLERAAAELTGGRDTIAEIALRSGFCDQSHLTRAFAARYRLTPAAYRRLHGTAGC